jgi:hypothetical protein
MPRSYYASRKPSSKPSRKPKTTKKTPRKQTRKPKTTKRRKRLSNKKQQKKNKNKKTKKPMKGGNKYDFMVNNILLYLSQEEYIKTIQNLKALLTNDEYIMLNIKSNEDSEYKDLYLTNNGLVESTDSLRDITEKITKNIKHQIVNLPLSAETNPNFIFLRNDILYSLNGKNLSYDVFLSKLNNFTNKFQSATIEYDEYQTFPFKLHNQDKTIYITKNSVSFITTPSKYTEMV